MVSWFHLHQNRIVTKTYKNTSHVQESCSSGLIVPCFKSQSRPARWYLAVPAPFLLGPFPRLLRCRIGEFPEIAKELSANYCHFATANRSYLVHKHFPLLKTQILLGEAPVKDIVRRWLVFRVVIWRKVCVTQGFRGRYPLLRVEYEHAFQQINCWRDGCVKFLLANKCLKQGAHPWVRRS